MNERIVVEIPDMLRREVKAAAAMRKMSMRAYVIASLKNQLVLESGRSDVISAEEPGAVGPA